VVESDAGTTGDHGTDEAMHAAQVDDAPAIVRMSQEASGLIYRPFRDTRGCDVGEFWGFIPVADQTFQQSVGQNNQGKS